MHMVTSRARGNARMARALWYTQPGMAEVRPAPIGPPMPDSALVRTLFSGLSRGTERLILNGEVGPSEYERMRAPMQDGAFPFPVKYGYCAAGVVERGPDEIIGKQVFCLHPHQDFFLAPLDALTLLPDGVPAKRATLAANMETALNGVWDGGAEAGDTIAIVGAGTVGLLIAAICAKLPGATVTVIDTNAARSLEAAKLGARFASPDALPPEGFGADVVFHASATSLGLATAISAAGPEAAIVEMSWHGNSATPVPLGGAFHSLRLRLISSQVGKVPPHKRARWSLKRRLTTAMRLLSDPNLDCLIGAEIDFNEAATAVPKALLANDGALAPVIRYPDIRYPGA